jgi:stage III sporulation protein AH
MKIQKKHILSAALILALGAAVYINWQFSGSDSVKATTKELGAATYVSRDAKATADEAKKGELTPQEKLAKMRTARSQSQDKALDSAKNILSLSDSSDDAKTEAARQAGVIQKRILVQSNIESILLAKGFSDVLCYVSDSGCTVTVKETDMEKDSPLIIKDAVMNQLDIEFNDIVIVEL